MAEPEITEPFVIEYHTRYDGSVYEDKYIRMAPAEQHHCPDCGVKGAIYKQEGEGDYYQGCTCVCMMCGSKFSEINTSGADAEYRAKLQGIHDVRKA